MFGKKKSKKAKSLPKLDVLLLNQQQHGQTRTFRDKIIHEPFQLSWAYKEIRIRIMEHLIDTNTEPQYKVLMKKLEDIVKKQQVLSNRLHDCVKTNVRKAKMNADYENFMMLTDEYFSLMGKRLKLLKPEAANTVRNTVLTKARQNLEANQCIWLKYMSSQDSEEQQTTSGLPGNNDETLGALGGDNIQQLPLAGKSIRSHHSSKSTSTSKTSKQRNAETVREAERKAQSDIIVRSKEIEMDRLRRKQNEERAEKEKRDQEELIKLSEELELLKLQNQKQREIADLKKSLSHAGSSVESICDEDAARENTVTSWLEQNDLFLEAPPAVNDEYTVKQDHGPELNDTFITAVTKDHPFKPVHHSTEYGTQYPKPTTNRAFYDRNLGCPEQYY
ncbi:MAG: hypothetical protein AAF902_23500 [Chloroflexota bacterium]